MSSHCVLNIFRRTLIDFMMNQVYKNIKIIGLKIIALLLSILMLFLSGCSSTKYEFKNKMSLSELSCSGMSLDENSISKINAYLMEYYYEDDSTCGFLMRSEDSINLYTSYNSVTNSILLGSSEQIALLKNNLSFLENSNVKNFGLLNLIYYVYICEELGYSYDNQLVTSRLNDFFDNETNLFFLNSKNDLLGIKIMITALCVQYLEPLISDKTYGITQTVNQLLNEFEFKCNEESTLYNCGGDVIYIASIMEIEIQEKLVELSDWYAFWKEIYERNSIDSVYSCIGFCEFLKIAKVFEPDYSSQTVSDYLNSLNKLEIEDIYDMQMINTMLESTEKDDVRIEIKQIISEKNNSIIQSGGLFTNEINERTTAFAIALAQWTGFSIDKQKINNYLFQRYAQIYQAESAYDQITYLYYLFFIDQMVNFPQTLVCDINSVQKIIDETFDSITYNPSVLTYDIDTSFRLVEIVSNLQTLGYDVSLSNKQVEKIKNGISKILQNEELSISIYYVYIDIMDYYLGLEIDEEIFDNVLQKLSTNEGCKMIDSSGIEADLYTTYMFIKSLELRDRSDDIDNLRKCISLYEAEESLFSLYSNGQDMSIMSTYFGCYIKNSFYKTESKIE